MKSKQEDLAKRGYLKQVAESNTYTLTEKILLLKSNIAIDRTLGARLLSKSIDSPVEELIKALKVEKKLYTKIEICNALVLQGEKSVKNLIAELGKIGSNQHKCVPEKQFGKDNYPIPRDIVGRTLAGIGKSAIPELLEVLENNEEKQLSEAIDTIGYICFYDYQPEVFEKLKKCYIKYIHNDLICWKIVRAMSGFTESVAFLSEQKDLIHNDWIKKEIARSLRLIEKRKMNKVVIKY